MKSAEFISDDLSQIKGFPFGEAKWDNEGSAKMLEFEYAAILRDRIIELRGEK